MTKKITELATKSSAAGTDVLAGVDMTANATKQFPVSGLTAGFSAKSIAITQVNGGATAGVFSSDTSGNVTVAAPTLGYAQITSSFTMNTGTTPVLVTGLSITITVPAGGRRVKVTAWANQIHEISGSNVPIVSLWDGTVGSGTQISRMLGPNNATGWPGSMIAVVTPAAGSKTYNVGMSNNGAGTAELEASSTYPAFIMAELV